MQLFFLSAGVFYPTLISSFSTNILSLLVFMSLILNLLFFRLPKKATWSVAAVGRHQFPMVELAVQKGGHVRVGMEDNIYLAKGVLAKSNAELVEKTAKIIKQQGFKIATPKEARKVLNLCLELESS